MQANLSVLFPATFAFFFVLERVVPARPLPSVRGWYLWGIFFYVMTSAIAALLPAYVASHAARFALVDLRGLGLVGGSAVGFLAAEFVGYWAHRLKHHVSFIWRWTHQLHHSAERVDLLGLNYFHPLDFALMLGGTALVTALLGVGPEVAAWVGYLIFACAAFGHLNVRTPRWLGYVVQRPENHALHHARGIHAYNYGNLPCWDLLFGTFRNPQHAPAEAGFWDGASGRVGAMLFGCDVAAAPLSRGSRTGVATHPNGLGA
jgi:sterol desaturase/sphingolipid hydroxylase (fatty acid hydroxylase superfamily)